MWRKRPFAQGVIDERGSVTVEFAMIYVLFLTLVFLVIQGVLIFNAWLVIDNAVREGARRGAPCYERSVNPCTTDGIIAAVRQAAGGVREDATYLTVGVSDTDGFLTVSASYSVPVIVPVIGAVVGDEMLLHAESVMLLEN